MIIAIRTDASNAIGTGHVMRCLTLAGVLRDKGAMVTFICREHDGNLCDLIKERGFLIHRIPGRTESAPPSHDYTPYHAPWLGTSWEKDADDTIEYIKTLDYKPDWLIVDHYALDNRWEKRLKSFVHRIFVIDDLADRVHDCDFLLDQNLVAEMETRYEGKVPQSCGLMLGPEYALLQPVYADLHDRVPPRSGQVRRILIYFGGIDSANLTSMAVKAAIALNRSDIEVDVVLSDRSPHHSKVCSLISDRTGFTLHGNLPSLAPLMVKADLAIGAAGTTSWERLCLGLPAIVISLADNQHQIAKGLAEQGLVQWVGDASHASAKIIEDKLTDILSSDIDLAWSTSCKKIVDGKGVLRVATAMLADKHTHLSARKVKLTDEMLLLSWANDPLTRKNSFSPEKITSEKHREWFYQRLRTIEGCQIFIIETEDGIPVGQVRFESNDGIWEIDYSVAHEFRNKGIGKSLLNTGLLAFRKEWQGIIVLGRVKQVNIASQKIFESLNFSAKSDGGGAAYQRLL